MGSCTPCTAGPLPRRAVPPRDALSSLPSAPVLVLGPHSAPRRTPWSTRAWPLRRQQLPRRTPGISPSPPLGGPPCAWAAPTCGAGLAAGLRALPGKHWARGIAPRHGARAMAGSGSTAAASTGSAGMPRGAPGTTGPQAPSTSAGPQLATSSSTSSSAGEQGQGSLPPSVEARGGTLWALGRPVLEGVPQGVTVRPCAAHGGAAAAHRPGVFLGTDSLAAGSRHVFPLGTLRDLRFLSCFRFNLWWMTQAVGTRGEEVPTETQFLLIECPPTGGPSPAAGNSTVAAAQQGEGAAQMGAGGASSSPGGGGGGRCSNQAVGDGDTVYVVALPVLEGAFRASLQGGTGDQLEACVESGDPVVTSTEAREAVFVHAGRNPYQTVTEAVRAVEAHCGTFKRRADKKAPEMLDYFGWCTWDAFYYDVTSQGIIDGLHSLEEGGFPPKLVIIDDGWQVVQMDSGKVPVTFVEHRNSRLAGLEENPKFQFNGSLAPSHAGKELPEGQEPTPAPAGEDGAAAAAQEGASPPAAPVAQDGAARTGLARLVQELKGSHSVKFVYMWHALPGYWGGADSSPLSPMRRFQPRFQHPVPSEGVLSNFPPMAQHVLTLNGLGVVHPDRIGAFYDQLHRYLAECGVDGVKVDVQNILETLGAGYGGRVALARAYHAALEASIRSNFRSNDIICCMSHNNDMLYSAQQSAVVRASDDFRPNNQASHTAQIVSVAYNSLFLGEFMQPDWDMFYSLHPAAEFHGAARAVGGCAIYVSDTPGNHDFNVLRKLVLPDGSVLRAHTPGRPTSDCLFRDPARDDKTLLKIWNLNPCNGVVAAFNCQGSAWSMEACQYSILNLSPPHVTGIVSAADVDTIADVAPSDWNGDVALYGHFSDELLVLEHQTQLTITLPPLHCEVYTVSPMQVLGDVRVAPIGFNKMYNAGGALLAMSLQRDRAVPSGGAAPDRLNQGKGKGFVLDVKGGGELLIYSSAEPRGVSIDKKPFEFAYKASCQRLMVDLKEQKGPLRVEVYY